MKYCLLMILCLLTSTAQASYCSGKNWQDAYQVYRENIDQLNEHIDRYNALLDKNNAAESTELKYQVAKLTITELDLLSIDVESLDRKFYTVEQLWLIISEHCLIDDELDYKNRAVENARGADIGRQEVGDLLVRIKTFRQYIFTTIEFINDKRQIINAD